MTRKKNLGLFSTDAIFFKQLFSTCGLLESLHANPTDMEG
jgi:hypothetical protein